MRQARATTGREHDGFRACIVGDPLRERRHAPGSTHDTVAQPDTVAHAVAGADGLAGC